MLNIFTLRIYLIFLVAVVHGVVLPSSFGSSKEFILQEVVDGVNFSRKAIETGELKFAYHVESLKPEMSEKAAKYKLGPALKYWTNQLAEADSENSRLKAEAKIEYLREHFEHLTKGTTTYHEENVVFAVRREADNQDMDKWFFRHNKIKKLKPYDAQKGDPLTFTPFQRNDLYVHLYNTIFTNAEYTAQLILTSISNAVVFDLPHQVGPSYHLFGRSPIAIRMENVTSFSRESDDNKVSYVVECSWGKDSPYQSPVMENEGSQLKVWVDPQLDFSIKRTETAFYKKERRILAGTAEFGEFRRFPGGIFYPTKATVIHYNPITQQIETRYLYQVLEADFNLVIPDDFLRLNAMRLVMSFHMYLRVGKCSSLNHSRFLDSFCLSL